MQAIPAHLLLQKLRGKSSTGNQRTLVRSCMVDTILTYLDSDANCSYDMAVSKVFFIGTSEGLGMGHQSYKDLASLQHTCISR